MGDPKRSARFQALEDKLAQIAAAIGPLRSNGQAGSTAEHRIAVHADSGNLKKLWDECKREQSRLSTTRARKRRKIMERWVEQARHAWEAEHGQAQQTTAQREAKQAALAEPSPLLRVAMTRDPFFLESLS